MKTNSPSCLASTELRSSNKLYRKHYFSLSVIVTVLTILLPFSQYAVAASGNRWALVIGNKDYEDAPLENPINDAIDMKAALERVGFKVIYRENADLSAMDSAVRELIRRLNKDSVAVFYYSGHGAQADGSNYLIPIGSDINSKSELKARAYDAGILLEEMQEVANSVNIIILDACRNNPFKGFRGGSKGLSSMSGPKGSLIAFATAPGSYADDNSSERNGTYTSYLKQYLVQPGLKVEEMFKKVREAVVKKNEDQVPWENSSIIGDFCFAGCMDEKPPEPVSKQEEDTVPEKMNRPNTINGPTISSEPDEVNVSGTFSNPDPTETKTNVIRPAARKRNETESSIFKDAEQGDVDAQFNLGTMYEDGHGVDQDDAKAVYWYRKAADQGDKEAAQALKELGDNARGKKH